MSKLDGFPRDRLDPARPTGLILCGMGGPDGPDAVEPFLRNLFRDPAIFPLPRLVAPLVGALIARKRAPAVAERYKLISEDGVTPQLQYTRDQARLLAGRLAEAGMGRIEPDMAMRYWHPFPDEAVARLLERGVDQFLVVPTYPQYSDSTGGSTLDFVADSLERLAPGRPRHLLANWHTLPGYLDDLARPVIRTLLGWAEASVDPGNCALIYAAHSMPLSFIKKGDPYEKLTRETVAAVHRRVRGALAEAGHGPWLEGFLSDPEWPLAYQSKVGPIEWLGPDVEKETVRLAEAGCRQLMVQPVSFVCEHIETLMELDIELKEEAEKAGVREFQRGPALNLQNGWLDSLSAELQHCAFQAGGSS
jgi:ferrochelatase